MKIWIDARNFSLSNYDFLKEFLENISTYDKENIYNIYADIYESFEDNIKIIPWKKYNSFLSEQINFLSKLKKDKNDLILSFDDTRPIFYKWDVIQIISSLEKILYPNLKYTKFFKKYSYLFTIKSNIKNAKQIICFDEKTKRNINEKLNIHEKRIKIIKWFFTKSVLPTSQIDIKSKHNIIWDYVIYDSLVWANKNTKRFLESIKETNKLEKLNVIFIWNEISDDFETRQLVLSLWLQKNCFFVWNIPEKELWIYYKNALWVIYPPIYESFPKSLSNAVFFNTPIIASESEEVKNIFWDKISYFSPLSTNNMTEKLKIFIQEKRKANYEEIKNTYNSKHFFDEVFKVINS